MGLTPDRLPSPRLHGDGWGRADEKSGTYCIGRRRCPICSALLLLRPAERHVKLRAVEDIAGGNKMPRLDEMEASGIWRVDAKLIGRQRGI